MSISNRAVLAEIRITQWSARKLDKDITRETNNAHGVKGDAGRYNKRLVAKGALDAVASKATALRDFHYTQSLPWGRDGARIVSALNLPAYQAGLRDRRLAFEDAVASFVAAYPDLVREARDVLNGAFREADYPPAEKVAARFTVEAAVFPVPEADDFRVQLSAEEVEATRREIAARVDGAVRDAWTRVHEAVRHMATKLREYRPAGGKGDRAEGVFRDSLVENVRALADLLPRLNVTADARLDDMARRLQAELCQVDADTLRATAGARVAVAEAAERILADMAGYV